MQYEIKGGNLPVVVCSLAPGQQMVTESGGMSWMSANMKMETTSNGGAVYVAGGMVDVNGYAFLYNTTAKAKSDYVN